MMNFPPISVGQIYMPLVKTKHGLNIYVKLPLVLDYDNPTMNINALMKNNPSISFRIQKVPSFPG